MGELRDDVCIADGHVETRELWIVQYRKDASYPWNDVGTERADVASALLTYDYGLEHHPDLEHRMVRTVVLKDEVDTEKLREQLESEKATEKDKPVLQSE